MPKMTKKNAVEKYGEQFPAAMGECADLLWKLKEQKSKVDKQADAIEKRMVGLRSYIIDNLPASKATGVAGKHGRVTIEFKEIIQAKDWDRFYKFLLKTKNPGLLQKRFSNLVSEMIDNGDDVPGTEVMKLKVVSLKKA